MEQIELTVRERRIAGKQVRQLRREGQVPAVIYGHGVEPMSLQVERQELRRVLAEAGLSHLIALHLEDGEAPRLALIRDVQRDVLTRDITHVDFFQVKMAEKITTVVPLRLVGESPAVGQQGGILLQGVTEVEIECLPGDLVDVIEVDLGRVAELERELTVADLVVPDNIEMLTDPEEMVVRVMSARWGREEEEEELPVAPAEVEVVGRRRREEEAQPERRLPEEGEE